MVMTQEEIVLIKGKRSKRPRPSSPLSLTTVSSSDEEDMANCLILLARGETSQNTRSEVSYYRCKTCDKSFSTFQALGGHRASHTKSPVKPMLLKDDDDRESTILSLRIPTSGNKMSLRIPTSGNKTVAAVSVRVHECSLCGAEFSSGQALGGHMRRHRPLLAGTGHKRPRAVLSLDLNLPAPQEQVIVFKAPSLIDCHF